MAQGQGVARQAGGVARVPNAHPPSAGPIFNMVELERLAAEAEIAVSGDVTGLPFANPVSHAGMNPMPQGQGRLGWRCLALVSGC
jgi:hypothetical protein